MRRHVIFFLSICPMFSECLVFQRYTVDVDDYDIQCLLCNIPYLFLHSFRDLKVEHFEFLKSRHR